MRGVAAWLRAGAKHALCRRMGEGVITAAELARRAGCDARTAGRWLRGEAVRPLVGARLEAVLPRAALEADSLARWRGSLVGGGSGATGATTKGDGDGDGE